MCQRCFASQCTFAAYRWTPTNPAASSCRNTSGHLSGYSRFPSLVFLRLRCVAFFPPFLPVSRRFPSVTDPTGIHGFRCDTAFALDVRSLLRLRGFDVIRALSRSVSATGRLSAGSILKSTRILGNCVRSKGALSRWENGDNSGKTIYSP